VLGAQGAGGNAATRIEAVATHGGMYAYGVLPEVEDLFQRQAREMDRKKREELLYQIQRIFSDRVVFAPIWENGFIRGVGSRVEEPALSLIPAFPYSAPFEDLRLKK
jgi:ABC-type transport system substrate-binding protein